MMNMKKIATMLVALICLALLLSLSLSAATPRLVDNADLLTNSEEASLLSKLDSLSKSCGHDIVVVTVNSLEGKNIRLYADDFYDENGYADSGVLLLVYIGSSYDRQYAISTAGDAIDIFSQSDLDSLEYAFLEHLKSGNYSMAFHAFADESQQIIKYDKRLSPIWIVISLIVGAAVAFLVLSTMKSKHKNVKMQASANSYMLRNTFRLDRSRNVLLYSHVTRRLKPQNNSSSGGGRSVSSSGRSHGGRSGRF